MVKLQQNYRLISNWSLFPSSKRQDSYYVMEVSIKRFVWQKMGIYPLSWASGFALGGLILLAQINISQALEVENGIERQAGIDLDSSRANAVKAPTSGNREDKNAESTTGTGFSNDWNASSENNSAEAASSAEMNLEESANDVQNASGASEIKGARSRKKNEAPSRKSQFNRRLGLSAHTDGQLSPRDFEERGKELQGQFYEIGGVGKIGEDLPVQTSAAKLIQTHARLHPWVLWVGAAGLAGASAGVVGYMLMGNAHPSSPEPKELVLTDQ